MECISQLLMGSLAMWLASASGIVADMSLDCPLVPGGGWETWGDLLLWSVPDSYVEILILEVIFSRWGLWKAKTSWLGLVFLLNRTHRAPSPFCLWGPKDSHLNQEAVTRHLICWHHDGILASRAVRSEWFLFMHYLVYGILLQQAKWTDTATPAHLL